MLMLSIRFDIDREWWVSGAIFERLFDGALAHGRLLPALHELRHVAEANGGLALADIDAADAHALKVGLCSEAQCELHALRVKAKMTETPPTARRCVSSSRCSTRRSLLERAGLGELADLAELHADRALEVLVRQ